MDIVTSGLTTPVALAMVALIGYTVGIYQRRAKREELLKLSDKLRHADQLIAQVASVSDQLRCSMATHHSTVARCREEIRILGEKHTRDAEPAHHMHLQDVLAPTKRLSDDIAHAYDELRQHSQELQRLRNA